MSDPNVTLVMHEYLTTYARYVATADVKDDAVDAANEAERTFRVVERAARAVAGEQIDALHRRLENEGSMSVDEEGIAELLVLYTMRVRVLGTVAKKLEETRAMLESLRANMTVLQAAKAAKNADKKQ
jgi:hypothetical protein